MNLSVAIYCRGDMATEPSPSQGRTLRVSCPDKATRPFGCSKSRSAASTRISCLYGAYRARLYNELVEQWKREESPSGGSLSEITLAAAVLQGGLRPLRLRAAQRLLHSAHRVSS